MTNEEFQKLILDKLTAIESGQRKLEIKIEHSIEPKIQALYEDRDIVHGKLDSIESEVKDLSSKLEKQELEIRVIKGGKKKKAQ